MSVVYLSDEWIAEADELLRGTILDPPVAEAFSIETIVTTGSGERRYVLEFDGPKITARHPRPGERATLRLTQRYDVAAAVARGDASAQAAFLDADIQLGGDVSTLIANAALVERVGDALAPLRARTRYEEA